MELEKSGSLTSDYTKKLPKSRQYSTSLNTSWQIDRETMETVTDFILGGSKITADGDCNHEIKTHAHWKKSYDKPRQCIKNQRHHFANKGPSSQSYGLFSRNVPMCELDHKEGRALKN